MSPYLIGGVGVLILLFLRRKTVAEKAQESADLALSDLKSSYSVKENLLTAAEYTSTGGGVGAALGGPIGFVIGTAVGWVAGLIALAIRGGVRMGFEVRKEIRRQYRALGSPATEAADDFFLWATFLTATNRIITVCEDGRIQLPFLKNQAHWAGESAQNLERFIDTFWHVLRPTIDADTSITPALKDFIKRHGLSFGRDRGNDRNPIGQRLDDEFFPAHFDVVLGPGRWQTVGEGERLEDVPYLSTVFPKLDVNHQRRKYYTGLLKENPEALKRALRWSASQFGVQNEPWIADAIETLGG